MLQKLLCTCTWHDGICHTSASPISKLMTPQHLSQLCQANPRARLRYISIQLHMKFIRFQKLVLPEGFTAYLHYHIWVQWVFCSFHIHKISAGMEYDTEEIHMVSPYRFWTQHIKLLSTLYGGNF